MDITYITERIIVITFPENGTGTTYRDNLKEVSRMLHTKHGNKYTLFNLSERRHDLKKLNTQVLEFGWPPYLAPPLERLCSICKAIDAWLSSDPQHIAVIHSKGDKGRTGVVIAAYMHYSNICASDDQALDRFAMKRFYDDKLFAATHASQRRYVNYFSDLLTGAVKMNNSDLYLHHVILHGVPNFDNKGGCKPFIKIYQGMQQVYTSGVHMATDHMDRIIMTVEPSLQLRGDILIKCYHKKQRPAGRTVIFRVQFHTCTVTSERIEFRKESLDDASNDVRFPEHGRLEIQFSKRKDDYKGNGDSSIPVDNSYDPITKWDSYENFDLVPEDNLSDLEDAVIKAYSSPVSHTEGPLDGSLYATVAKKSPTVPNMPSNATQANHDNLSDVEGPHTISMDSGISSSSGVQGHGNVQLPGQGVQVQGLTNGTSEYPHDTTDEKLNQVGGTEKKPSPNHITLSEQAQLDELLDGMLKEIQSIPDAPLSYYNTVPRNYGSSFYSPNPPFATITTTVINTEYSEDKPYVSRYSHSSTPTSGVISVNGTKHTFDSYKWTSSTEDEQNQPYHTRKKSTPFSYGIQPGSPALQRRRTQSESGYVSEGTGRQRSDEAYLRDSSASPEPVGSDAHLTWLQRQQQKLRQRKEGTFEDRHRREQLLAELRSAQTHNDGPESIEENLCSELSNLSRENSPAKQTPSYSTPLQINTFETFSSAPTQTSSPYTTAKPPIYRGLSAPSSPIIPSRTSSREVTRNKYPQFQTHRPVARQKSDTSFDRERPFVIAQRHHQLTKEQLASGGTSPQDAIASSAVYGNIYSHSPSNISGTDDSRDVLDGLSGSPKLNDPASQKLDELESSLQVLTASHSPSHSPLPPGRQSPMFCQSTPNKADSLLDSSASFWSSSVAGTSPSASPLECADRPATPAFPIPPRTPYMNHESVPTGLPPKSPTLSRKDRSPSPLVLQDLSQQASFGVIPYSQNGQSSPTVYFGHSRRSSMQSLSDSGEVIHHHPMFVKDTSKFWYKPNISREEAISILKDKPPGTFIVRDSNSFPGAFGLALKVASPPPNIPNRSGDLSNELVRHFLIEPTQKGVHFKGCANEPVFGSLSALVYQHSITPMALPCRLLLPDSDLIGKSDVVDGGSSAVDLLHQGAACNVLYLCTMDMESLTGPQAIRRAVTELLQIKPLPIPTVVHFKASSQGITLTDNSRKLFFRRHYPVNSVSFCGQDPEDRRWTQRSEDTGLPTSSSRCFGFVARKPACKTDNQCHLFAELEPEQPASAIVNFVTKVTITGSHHHRSNMV